MNVYELNPVEGLKTVLVAPTPVERISFDGSRRNYSWEKSDFTWFRKIHPVKGERIHADVINLNTCYAYILNKSAGAILKQNIDAECEFLPLVSPENEEYSILNITNVIDALDRNKSELDAYNDGEIFYIDSYSFKSGAIPDSTLLFKLTDYPMSMFASENFYTLIKEKNLKGFRFTQIREG